MAGAHSKRHASRALLEDKTFNHALTHSVRAIGENPKLSVSLGNQLFEDPLRMGDQIVLSSAAEIPDAEPKRYLRAQADTAALVKRYHNRAAHLSHQPAEEKARAVFDALECARVEAIGSLQFDGIRHNLSHRHAIYCEIQGYGRVSERADPPLADILAMLVRERLTGEAPPDAIGNLVALWKPYVLQHAGETLDRLADSLEQQATYSQLATQLLRDLSLLPDEGEAGSREKEHRDSDESEQDEPSAEPQEDDAPPAPSSMPDHPQEQDDQQEETELVPSMEEREHALQEQDEPAGPQYRPNHPAMFQSASFGRYQAYTTRYDEVVEAATLASTEDSVFYRKQLDEQLSLHQSIHTRLAAKLQRLLLARQTREWAYDQEDGLIDNARLARLIIHPEQQAIYKIEKPSRFRDSVVTLLIDNSGSMRGRPITLAAMSADILARTLERCGVKTEILGFTTKEWKGGQSRKAWERAGKPAAPGRLNDLRHIIYKSAETRLHKARRHLGLMLKDGLLKENIDGEALLWAHQRLLARPEQRRILMVISDGAPVDDSTLSLNSSSYLDQHLRGVIERIEAHSAVELTAIGIGHDVTRYYRRAITIHEAEKLGDTMLTQMMQLFQE